MREKYRFKIRREYLDLVHSLLAAGTNPSMKGSVLMGDVGDENDCRTRECSNKCKKRMEKSFLLNGKLIGRTRRKKLMTRSVPDEDSINDLAAEEYGMSIRRGSD